MQLYTDTTFAGTTATFTNKGGGVDEPACRKACEDDPNCAAYVITTGADCLVNVNGTVAFYPFNATLHQQTFLLESASINPLSVICTASCRKVHRQTGIVIAAVEEALSGAGRMGNWLPPSLPHLICADAAAHLQQLRCFSDRARMQPPCLACKSHGWRVAHASSQLFLQGVDVPLKISSAHDNLCLENPGIIIKSRV